MRYWSIVEPVWHAINIYDGPEVFAQTFGSAPTASRLMFAAHFCQSEICATAKLEVSVADGPWTVTFATKSVKIK